LDDEGFDWNTDLTKTLNLLRKRNIPVIVANTDKTYPASKSRLSIAVGALAKMIEDTIGRQFIRFGKPDPQMFIFAYQHIKNYPNVSKRDILMVGDTLHTDILGGNKFGLDTALVLTGNTQAEDAEVRIRSTGIIPTYICVSAVVE
jgi:HAD superfamily hydrolase (TIGR01450 family)